MIETLKYWYATYLANSKAAALIFMLIGSTFFIWYAHPYLRPFWLGLIFTYLLDRPVSYLERMKIPRSVGSLLILGIIFAGLVCGICLLPGIVQQATLFTMELPSLIEEVQEHLRSASRKLPLLAALGIEKVDILTPLARFLSHHLLNFSLYSIQAIAWWLFDLFLFPFITFFFLKDKHLIFRAIQKILPNDSIFFTDLVQEIDKRMHRYVLGKLIEFIIVWVAAALLFYLYDFRFQRALAFAVGLSTFLPYLGVLLVSIPVVLTAVASWGCFSSTTIWALTAYFILQFVEGNILASFLCSEAVDLHPLTIVLAVSILGGIWGIPGIIFSVPLATLAKLMLLFWPKQMVFSEEAANALAPL